VDAAPRSPGKGVYQSLNDMRMLHDMVVLICTIGLFGKSVHERCGHGSYVENIETSSQVHENGGDKSFPPMGV
jgi:hypothetical protein